MALFRSYDASIGRWWQIGPKNSERESAYVGMANNPILYSDMLGDTTRYYSPTGQYISKHNDNLPNEDHVLTFDRFSVKQLEQLKKAQTVDEKAALVRSWSAYYIGKETRDGMRKLVKKSNKIDKEVPMLYIINSRSRELEVVDLSKHFSKGTITTTTIDGGEMRVAIDKYKLENPNILIVSWGHTHQSEDDYQKLPQQLNHISGPKQINASTGINPSDYTPLIDNPFSKDRLVGNNMSILSTEHGYTIYRTAYRQNGKYVFPQIESYVSKSHYKVYNYNGLHIYTRD